MEEDSNISQEKIFEIIENQLRDNKPPIVNETYNRIKSEGYSHVETLKLIRCALSAELLEIISSKQEFSEERYSNNLRTLPELPWEKKEANV